MRWGRVILFCLVGFSCVEGYAQVETNRCKWVSQAELNKFVQLDTLTVLPGEAKLVGVDESTYEIEYNVTEGKILIRYKEPIDSVQVCYEVLPLSLHKTYYKRSLVVYDSNAIFKDPPKVENGILSRDELFATEGLNKSGSISRGISFGSNQDVFVNSTLNLNLDGKLSDDLNIRAAITDQNVPFQPEGNTQQLQDFDNVFIEIYNDQLSLKGGDVVFQDRSSFFLKYYKNVQGGLANINYGLTEADSASTSLGISVAKGRFASVQIEPKEGLLGPYRIPGPGGESFVIVLANSERVFLDGKQLTRGFNQDYVIDYNAAEITFTNKVLITQFSRIRIDYEFSDQDYNRTITVGKHSHKIGKLQLDISAYSEKDSKNRPLLVELSNEDKLRLSEIGDSLEFAFKPGADSVGFSNEQIRYARRDTLNSNGQLESIFVYSTDPDEAIYQVTFSDVGNGNGNYIQQQTTANGRVYQWIDPTNEIPQGRFEPIIDIPVPDKKQMVSVKAGYQLNKHESISSEVAFSDQDVNLFSPIDDEDDNGAAIKVGIESNGRELSFLPKYKLNVYTDFEFDNKNFRPIDRFRYIEYDRDWSYIPQADDENVSDRIFNIGFGLSKDSDNNFSYRFSNRDRKGQVDGIQHEYMLNKRISKFKLISNGFYLDNNLDILRSTWKRFSADVSYVNKFLVPGYRYSFDHNQVKSKPADSVVSSAMYFDEHLYYLRNAPDKDWDFVLQYAKRYDKLPQNGEVEDFTSSNTTQLTIGKDMGDDRVDVLFTYRELHQEQLDEVEETVSGRIDWNGLMLDNHVRSDLTYAISNSQELRREFVYVKVPTGEGTHTWRDLNNDNVQDLNEFFEAINPDERNYAKIFVPTNDFVTAFQTLFVYNVYLESPRAWRSANGLKSFISTFSNNTNWSADTKTTQKDLTERLLAFARDIDTEALIAERNSLRSTLFYNRANPTYGFDFTYFDTESRQLLVNGFEATFNTSYDLNLRYNVTKSLTLKLRTVEGEKVSASDFLDGRNYLINSLRINPEIAWQPTNSIRFSMQHNYLEKRNDLSEESNESAFLKELIAGVRLNKAVKSSLNAQFRWTEIDFTGDENTPLGYDLLNALRPGTNISWSINWQQRIMTGLQLNLSYDGRKSESTDVIHVGRVQVSALF